MSLAATGTLLERVRALIGGDAAWTPGRAPPDSPPGLAAADLAVAGVAPAVVALPSDDDALAALLAAASAEGWAVEPAGRAGRLGRCRRPTRVDVLLSTARLAAVHEYEPDDLTAGVGAGMTHDALAARLRQHDQWLPLDPPGAERGTLGATFALAEAGPLRAAFGTPRDHLLGLRLVTGDGRVLDVGGRVVKNVAGYDMTRLAVGSDGTLGVITRLHVRVRPVPEVDRTLAWEADDARSLLDGVAAGRARRLDAAALELLSPALAARCGLRRRWTLLIRCLGVEARVADATTSWREAIGRAPAGEPMSPWAALAQREHAAPVVLRVARRPAEAALALESARELVAALDAPGGSRAARGVATEPGEDGPELALHAADGIVRVLGPSASGRPEPLGGALADARAALDGEGTVLVTRAPAAWLTSLDPWGATGPALELMRGIRARLDPAGVLAPGHRGLSP